MRISELEQNGYTISQMTEGFGPIGNLGVVLLLKHNLKLTEEDRWPFAGLVDEAYKTLQDISYREDPERPAREAKIKADLIACFGYDCQPIYVKEIPNEYFGRLSEPWLIVTTAIGHIKIGWRKRVIQIDWSQTDLVKTAEDLFPEENVTKDKQMIHAWSYEKAKEYLSVLHMQLM